MEKASKGAPESELSPPNRKLSRLGRDFRLLVKQRDEALQQLIDAQVAINEEDPSEENQQKLEELRYSIREEVKDLEGDSLIDGENPMNSVRNKE